TGDLRHFRIHVTVRFAERETNAVRCVPNPLDWRKAKGSARGGKRAAQV
ncbi:MAG: hypothetical protein ACI82H_000925, partial [Alphaproteobacteria bacterium]